MNINEIIGIIVLILVLALIIAALITHDAFWLILDLILIILTKLEISIKG